MRIEQTYLFFIEKSRVDLLGRLIDKAVIVKQIKYLTRSSKDRASGGTPDASSLWGLSIDRNRHGIRPERAGSADAHVILKRGRIHDFSSLLPLRSSATFFWTSMMSSACLSLWASLHFPVPVLQYDGHEDRAFAWSSLLRNKALIDLTSPQGQVG